MEYSFDINVAQKYGVDEAIVIKNFQFWIMKNKASGKHFYDGRTWTYNSNKAFIELFPFWKEYQIRRVLDSLMKQGVVITGNYNQNTYDRTLWYAFADEEILNSICENPQMENTKNSNRIEKNSKPIPDNKPNAVTDNNTKKSPDSFPLADDCKGITNCYPLQNPSEAIIIAQYLYDSIKKKSDPPIWKNKSPDLQKWSEDIERLHRIDKINYADIRAVIDWATSDSFWSLNILSAEKLRKQFNRLYLQMRQRASPQQRKGFNPNDSKQQEALSRILAEV